MTIQALKLDEQKLLSAQNQAKAIADSAKKTISDSTFVYFAAFDGTNNDKDNLPLSGNKFSTNVAELSSEVVQTSNVKVHYFPGPGTDGKLDQSSWLFPLVTEKVIKTAEDAYNDFAASASI